MRKASDMLLEVRENIAGMVSWDPYRAASHLQWLPLRPWSYLDAVHSWPITDVQHGRMTHLEVVEMIERAAAAALREENGNGHV